MVQISPGVNFSEIDLNTVVPQVDTSVAGFAGLFRWGPIGQRVLIDSETTLVSTFGQPTNHNPESFFVCSSFLAYSGSLLVVRCANVSSSNISVGVISAVANVGTVSNAALLECIVANPGEYTGLDGTFASNVAYIARYAGEMGNSLRVAVCETAAQFTSVINIASYGANGTVFTAIAGVNAATLEVFSTSVASANANAVSLANLFSIGDLVLVGNSTIGRYYQKVTGVQYDVTANAAGNTTTGNATVTINFEGTFNSHTTFTANDVLQRNWEFFDLVDSSVGQSDYVANFGNAAANDELHIVVVDDGGMFSGIPGTILEIYKNVSRATDSQQIDGGTNYYKNIINHQSRFIWWANDHQGAASANAALIASATTTAPLDINFQGGSDGADEANASVGVIATGFDLFASPEDVDVGLIITGTNRGGTDGGQLANYIVDNITSIRRDCVAFISPNKQDVVNNTGEEADAIVAFRNTLRSTSYGFLDSGYKYMYDRYNDINRWIPLCGDMAGLCALTEHTNDAWWSPAGFNRGQIKNYIQLSWNPRQAFRDQLYKNGINPVVSFPGQGAILYGDKTMLSKPSAFDRINVRRLFIVLEKAISDSAKFTLFEFNDSFTQAQFRNMVNPYLRDIKGRRGITDFLVVCDDTNNTPQIVDTNQFVGDIYVKPARSINFIQLNFIAVPTGVQFAEVIGQFG
jgi:hypothetical protein